MSMVYSIAATLDLAYDTFNMQQVLKKGIDLGFLYYDDDGISISLEQIIINSQFVKKHRSIYPIEILTYKYKKDTICRLLLSNWNGRLGIMFCSFGCPRSIKNPKEWRLDLHHYAHVMFDLISNFKIIEFNIEKD